MEISPGNPLSQTGSARCTDLSYFSHRIWEIHAKYACFLRMQLLAKIGYIPQCKGKNPRGLNEILLLLQECQEIQYFLQEIPVFLPEIVRFCL